MQVQFNNTNFRVRKIQPTFTDLLWPDGRPEEQQQREQVEEERKLARHYRRLSAQTRRTYRCCLQRFDKWRAGRTIDDDLIAVHLEEEFAEGKSFSSLRQTITAIRWRAKRLKQERPTGEEVEAVMKRAQREGRSRQRRAVPLLMEDVDKLLSACDGDNAFRVMWSRRDAAAFSLAFNCGLRVSEVRALDIADIRFSESGSAALHIRFSKTDQGGRGHHLKIAAPVAARLRRWLEVSGLTSGPLFPCIGNGAVCQQRMTTDGLQVMLRRRLAQAEITQLHTWHDFRRGMASQMTLNGASIQQVQAAGRWETPEMVMRYCAGAAAIRDSATEFLFQDEKPALRAVK